MPSSPEKGRVLDDTFSVVVNNRVSKRKDLGSDGCPGVAAAQFVMFPVFVFEHFLQLVSGYAKASDEYVRGGFRALSALSFVHYGRHLPPGVITLRRQHDELLPTPRRSDVPGVKKMTDVATLVVRQR